MRFCRPCGRRVVNRQGGRADALLPRHQDVRVGRGRCQGRGVVPVPSARHERRRRGRRGHVERADAAGAADRVAEPQLAARHRQALRRGVGSGRIAVGLGEGDGVDLGDRADRGQGHVQLGGIRREHQARSPLLGSDLLDDRARVIGDDDAATRRIADEHPIVHSVDDDVPERGAGQRHARLLGRGGPCPRPYQGQRADQCGCQRDGGAFMDAQVNKPPRIGTPLSTSQ